MIMEAPGSRSEGLSIRVLPVTTARGIVHSGIMLQEFVIFFVTGRGRTLRREVEWSDTKTQHVKTTFDDTVSMNGWLNDHTSRTLPREAFELRCPCPHSLVLCKIREEIRNKDIRTFNLIAKKVGCYCYSGFDDLQAP
jgi:hypothetical protein